MSPGGYFRHYTENFVSHSYSHAAGTLVDHGTHKKIPVVTGGIGAMNGQLNSTEFLINGEWLKGKNIENLKIQT